MTKAPSKEEVSRFLEAWLGARQLIQAANFNHFQKAGLSATQFMTLNLLPASTHGLTLTELARKMNLSAATVAKTIDSLQDRGMLTRTQSDADRRQVLITLTAKGRALQNAASSDFHQHMAALFRSIDPDQRRALIEGLEALVSVGTVRGAGVLRDGDAAKSSRAAGAGPREKRSARRPLMR